MHRRQVRSHKLHCCYVVSLSVSVHAFVCCLSGEKHRRKPIKRRRKDPNPQPLDASTHDREPSNAQTRRISDETPATQTRRTSEETPAAQTTQRISDEKNTRLVQGVKSSDGTKIPVNFTDHLEKEPCCLNKNKNIWSTEELTRSQLAKYNLGICHVATYRES